jgi:CheY-like chemotaxis protein
LERFVAPPELAGLRVLVVEDEELVSFAVESLLDDLQCQVVGPYSDLKPALEAAQRDEFDLGLLDIHLRGATSFSIAEVLAARHKPFIFTSGYGEEALPPNRAGWLVCSKPFRGEDLAHMMVEAVRVRGAH